MEAELRKESYLHLFLFCIIQVQEKVLHRKLPDSNIFINVNFLCFKLTVKFSHSLSDTATRLYFCDLMGTGPNAIDILISRIEQQRVLDTFIKTLKYIMDFLSQMNSNPNLKIQMD